MKHCEGTFKGSDGLKLFYQGWQTQKNAKAAIAIIHCMGEHSNCYMNIVNHFVPRGYNIHAFDLRGNGRSPGHRDYINSWIEIRNDISALRAGTCQYRTVAEAPSLTAKTLSTPERLSGTLNRSSHLMHFRSGEKDILLEKGV